MLTGKYCEYLPLYRQSEIFACQGIELSRALLSNWVDACCQLMTPLNDALYRYVMNTYDDTLRIPLYSITDWHRSPISDSHPFDQPGT